MRITKLLISSNLSMLRYRVRNFQLEKMPISYPDPNKKIISNPRGSGSSSTIMTEDKKGKVKIKLDHKSEDQVKDNNHMR